MFKKEVRRLKCSIEKIFVNKKIVTIRLINHPHLVYGRIPIEFFDKIGFPMERFWMVIFDDDSVDFQVL